MGKKTQFPQALSPPRVQSREVRWKGGFRGKENGASSPVRQVKGRRENDGHCSPEIN